MRIALALSLLAFTAVIAAADEELLDRRFGDLSESFGEVRATLRQLCFDCHKTAANKGELDLERFATFADVRADLKPWQAMIQQLETREMPPKDQPQPTDAERNRLIDWTRELLDTEACARAGDPGYPSLGRVFGIGAGS